MKQRKGLIFFLVVAACMVVLAHSYVFSLVSVPGEGLAPALLQGDRLLVNRWSYGLRAPFSDRRGYERWKEKPAHRGEWIAYNRPAQQPTNQPDTLPLCLGAVMALPGDTVWMGRGAHISTRRSYAHGAVWPLVVPSKGAHLKVHPWDVELYAQTLRYHEGVEATVRGDSLFVDGKAVQFARFTQDYHWLTTLNDSNLLDSRTLGFVPTPYLLGRIELVVYSLDGWRPRWKRTMLRN